MSDETEGSPASAGSGSRYLPNAAALIGKTIAAVEFMRKPDYDDRAWMVISFTDGTQTCVVASYGGWTAKSEDEYPAFVGIMREMPAGLVRVEGEGDDE
jgi:hypothetical protein